MDGVHCVTRIEKISHTLRSQESMAFSPTLAQTIQVAPAPCEVRVSVAQTWNQDSSVPFKTPFLWILQQKMFSHDHSNLCETFTWEWIRAGRMPPCRNFYDRPAINTSPGYGAFPVASTIQHPESKNSTLDVLRLSSTVWSVDGSRTSAYR